MLISVPNAAVVNLRSASSSSENGITGNSNARPIPMSRISGVIRSKTDGPTARVATRPADRHRHRQPVDPGNLVTHPLGQQDVAGPADSGAERVEHADRVDRARPRLGQEHDADGCQSRPKQAALSAAVHHGDAEWAEELQRAGGAQRNPVERGHEQQGDRRGHHAQHDAHAEGGPGERRGAGTDQDEEQHAGPRQPQPRRSLDTDLVDKPMAIARPSCTHSMEAIAINAPVRAWFELTPALNGSTTVHVHVIFLDISFVIYGRYAAASLG